jgi:transposase InsO family protein
VIDFVKYIVPKSHIKVKGMIKLLGITKSKYYEWTNRYSHDNHHNGKQPKQHWLTPIEQQAIDSFARSYMSSHQYYLNDGYRRITYAGIDKNLFACSPSSVYRLLTKAGLLSKWKVTKTNSKGSGYNQPDRVHKEWHIDIKYINYKGTFLFLISIMDGYSRYIVHHELRLSMEEYDIEIVVQRALEKYPEEKPRIISDNGSQFTSKDFRIYLKEVGLQHVRTSPSYPQSNGKIERFHRSLEEECLRTTSMINIDDARDQVAKYIYHYNHERLHSALFYLRPIDFLQGDVEELLKSRQDKIDEAAKQRQNYWNSKIFVA